MADGPQVESFVGADDVPSELTKPVGKSSTQLTIDKSFDGVLSKITGDPCPGPSVDDARREAYLAYELARRADVQGVLLGDEAVKFLYDGKSKAPKDKDCDVIAFLRSKEVIVGDSKGVDFGKALAQQLPYSTRILQGRGIHVVEGIVLATLPQVLVVNLPVEGGHEWKLAGTTKLGITPAELAQADGVHPFDPKYLYLLDRDFHDKVHNPAGLAIEPHVRFSQLRTHVDAPRLSPAGHMTSGIWTNLRPFIIPTTTAHVRLGFVRK